MSRSAQEIMQIFIESFDLDVAGDNMFIGHSPDFGWQRIFGGQTISQSLVAAKKTVDDDRYVHSLHAYFVRWGDPKHPVTFKVERIRDGASFSVRSVTASQSDRTILTIQISFQKNEDGLFHQTQMPDVPMPETIDPPKNLLSASSGEVQGLLAYLDKDRPMEFRPLSLDRLTSNKPLPPHHATWFRLIDRVPEADDAHMSAVMLSYISDALLIDTALFPHSTNIFDGSLQGGSLDHAIWFHRPFKLDDWVLYDMDSPSAFGARGFTRGHLFKKDGTLLASVAQQGLIRKRANAK